MNEAWDNGRYPNTHTRSMYSAYRRNPWNPHGVGAWCMLRNWNWDYGGVRSGDSTHVVAKGSYPGGPREKTTKGELPWIQFDLGWNTWVYGVLIRGRHDSNQWVTRIAGKTLESSAIPSSLITGNTGTTQNTVPNEQQRLWENQDF